MEEPPLNAAHAYAAQAEEYAAKGLIEKAAQAHHKAAENYLKAQENTENPEALQALSSLHAQHLAKYQYYSTLPKAAPQQTRPQQPVRQSSRPKQPSRQRSLPKAFHSVTSSTASIASTLAHARAPPIREEGSLLLIQTPYHNNRQRYPPQQQQPPSPQQISPPSSQESGSPTGSTTSTGSTDPFDKFYTSLQEMLSRLSHPLAFATAPLDGTPVPEYGQESFYVVPGGEDQMNGMGDTIVPITRSMAGTMLYSPPPVAAAQRQEGRDSTKTLEEYAVENRQLKIAVDQLSRKVASYKETAISSSSLLKSSMAHLRAINQHPQSRIADLEAEVRRLTIENTKIKADLEKAQRRWEKLKEGARRRRRDGGTGTPASTEDVLGTGGTPSIPESAEEGKE